MFRPVVPGVVFLTLLTSLPLQAGELVDLTERFPELTTRFNEGAEKRVRFLAVLSPT